MSDQLQAADFRSLLRSYFPYSPTTCQELALDLFDHLFAPDSPDKVLILKGYAGTGKTTLIKALADAASSIGKQTILLSPTGRGAKVMSEISGHEAHTIHKHIYYFEMKANGSAMFRLSFNKYSNALFIVDEASMIHGGSQDTVSDDFIMPDTGVLHDLFEYIESNSNNKIVIIGDPAQLPPVNHTSSPALNERFISSEFSTSVVSTTLREIVRQERHSGILHNATIVRNLIESSADNWPMLETEKYKDILIPQADEIQDMISDAFSKSDNDAVIITLSNKMANKYNAFIRNIVLGRENIIDGGDHVMAVKNNYYWLTQSGSDFIANGEMMLIRSVRNVEEKYGLQFADVSVQLPYQKGEPVVDMKILLDTLHLPSAALPYPAFMEMWEKVIAEHGGKRTKKLSKELMRENPYLNALQIKFAHALTCHKAQGGQWNTVFVDTEFLMKRPADLAGLRWLYTALTRATKKLVMLR